MKSLKKTMLRMFSAIVMFGMVSQSACTNAGPVSENTSSNADNSTIDTGNSPADTEKATNGDGALPNDTETNTKIDGIVLANQNYTAPICIDAGSEDYDGISLVADAVSKDIELITGHKPETLSVNNASEIPENPVVIIAGTLNDQLIKEQNLTWEIGFSNNDSTSDEWERYQIQVIEDGGKTKIIIAGSDKRGTIYGLFYVSQDLGGVSPWVYWADAKPEHIDTLAFKKEELEITSKTPSVKYRGIFLNDEAPSLSNFVGNQFGNYNYLFYSNVFELILRLKGNYLWPAMWGNSFSDDGISRRSNAKDMSNWMKLPAEEHTTLANALLADRYGVVMGLSHHEPMSRAGVEWQNVQRGTDPTYNKPTVDNAAINIWNYFLNRDNIYDFWVDGFNRNKDFDNITPIGMRGEADSELKNPDGTPFTLLQNIELLKSVITDQKEIIKNTGHEEAVQALVLYKEVEKYWYGEEGTPGLNEMDELMNDIIVLCEDNNNFLRTLPMENERNRKWGIYYHFDYNGGPKTYMWLNVTPLQRIWDNMTMAYDYKIDDLWIVNVGDLKPMELPISYFMDMAYDFDTYGTNNPNSSKEYTKNWVEQQFSGMQLTSEQIDGIVQILIDYVDMNGRKRPETIFSDTFSTVNYNEAEIELAKAVKLENDANEYLKLFENTEYADTFYQLVYYPAAAVATVNKMWIFQGLNELYAKNGSVLANAYADLIKHELQKDKDLLNYYNNEMSGGYWRGMMSQVNHTGFTGWNHESVTYPEPNYVEPKPGSELIVYIQGSESMTLSGETSLLDFENTEQQQYAIILSNSGIDKVEYNIEKSHDWIMVEAGEGSLLTAKTLGVSIDWSALTAEETGTITITSGEQIVVLKVNVKIFDTSSYDEMTFFPSNDIISINSNNYADKKAAADGTEWMEIENYGKTGSTMKMAPTTSSFSDATDAPYLEYKIYVPESGRYTLTAFVGASNNRYYSEVTMRYGVQIDGSGEVKLYDTLPNGYVSGDSYQWNESILNAGRTMKSIHELEAGTHTIRIYGIDAGLLLEKIVLSKNNLKKSHFGPAETFYVGKIVSQQPLVNYEITDAVFNFN